jgi:FAD synthetase
MAFNGVSDSLTEDLGSKLEQSQSVSEELKRPQTVMQLIQFQVLNQSLEKYERKQIFLSFNGGKDCTVLLHILSELLKDSIEDLKVIYFRSSDPFQEIEDFVKSCESFYGINISTIESDRGMKEVLTEICEKDSEIAAAIMGSRRTDPWCENLNSFQVGQSRNVQSQALRSFSTFPVSAN